MDYREGTAGSLMTTELVALRASLTAQEAIDQLREMAPSVETIYYIYVVDQEGRLLGVVSLRELIVAPPQTPLENIMRRNVATLAPDDDHERILEITEKYALLAAPVVDEESKLLGIVTFDDVLETLLPEQRGTYLAIVRALKKY
jgi:magnesium transporter